MVGQDREEANRLQQAKWGDVQLKSEHRPKADIARAAVTYRDF
jgi:hypothetical protein